MCNKQKKSPGIFSIIQSVLAAMIGVQSDQNRERDFTQGQMGPFIFVGIVIVALFVIILISVVNGIVANAAS